MSLFYEILYKIFIFTGTDHPQEFRSGGDFRDPASYGVAGSEALARQGIFESFAKIILR